MFFAYLNVLPFYGEMFHFLSSHVSTRLSYWLPWIFIFVFIFSFHSPCGTPMLQNDQRLQRFYLLEVQAY